MPVATLSIRGQDAALAEERGMGRTRRCSSRDGMASYSLLLAVSCVAYTAEASARDSPDRKDNPFSVRRNWIRANPDYDHPKPSIYSYTRVESLIQ